MSRTRWQQFNATEADGRYRLRRLTRKELPSFALLDARLLSLGDKASEIQMPDGTRLNFPTRAMRSCAGSIAFSKEALRQRGLYQ